MPKTTVYIAITVGPQAPPAGPSYVVWHSPYRFTNGSTVNLPEPAPTRLDEAGTGVVSIDSGVWIVDEVLPTQVIRRAVFVPESASTVLYGDLREVTDPVELGFGPTWAQTALEAAQRAEAVVDRLADLSVDAVEAAVAGLAVMQVSQSGGTPGGGLQHRHSNGALSWITETPYVDQGVGTTLPDEPTIAALEAIGFVRVKAGDATPGVGFGIRAGDGRPTALETDDAYDENTGIIGLSLRSTKSIGIVRRRDITPAELCTEVPYGRFIFHEQPDGIHVLLGEKINA